MGVEHGFNRTMETTMRWIFCAVLVLFLFGCGSPESDLNAICDEANKFKAGAGEYDSTAPDKKMMLMAKNVDARIRSKPIRSAMDALAAADPEQRYRLLQAAAKAEGVKQWQCLALEELWGSSGEQK